MDKIRLVIQQMRMYGQKINKNRLKTYIDMIFSIVCYGASPSNYYYFEFFNASLKERATYLTHRYNEKLQHKYNQKSDIWRLENKFEFETKYVEYCRRGCAKISVMDYEYFKNQFIGKKVIYKPII